MAQQIELRKISVENEEQEYMNLQRMTSVEEREDRRKMREIFDLVCKLWNKRNCRKKVLKNQNIAIIF